MMRWLMSSLLLALVMVCALRFAWRFALGQRRRQLRRRIPFGVHAKSPWFLWTIRWVLGAAFFLSLLEGRLVISGLVSLMAIPFLFRAFAEIRALRFRWELEKSGVAYFHALRGLVHAGLGLPSALYLLAHASPSPFSRAMAKSLDAFESGQGFSGCLEGFGRKVPLERIGTCLQSLQLAYQRGVSVAPLLDRIVPLLERERETASRIASLRRSVLAQSSVAFLAPWILTGFLVLFEPAAVEGMRNLKGTGLVMLVVGVEGLGVCCLFHVSEF